MKKICFVTTISGTLKAFVLDTAKYLHENGDYRITFICNNDEEFAQLLPDYIRYIPVSMERGISLSGIKAVFELYSIFRREKFDMVQYSTPNASFYASIAARFAAVPVRLYCQWGIRYVSFNGFSRRLFKKIEKITCFLSTSIRAVSPQNMKFSINEGLYKPEKVKVLGQGGTIGVDINHYDIENRGEYNFSIRKQYGINNEFVYGFVGRLSKDKGVNELLAAFKNISTDEDVKLFIIGETEINNGIDRELINWAKNSSKAIFTGRINNSKIKEYYAAFDCFVHPSYREGFGMVIQEAAAMGCPIITTDIPGASEVMEKDISCLLAKVKDQKALEDKMKLVLSEINLRHNLSRNARARVEACFERSIKIEEQRLDYEELLK
ncbi:MAG: glycosyltransferase family 4 protein [Syntrophomonadaceae bacterium]|nr:glycosyltransferase family 4 protein [Syntrophomonadaceae bacterium]